MYESLQLSHCWAQYFHIAIRSIIHIIDRRLIVQGLPVSVHRYAARGRKVPRLHAVSVAVTIHTYVYTCICVYMYVFVQANMCFLIDVDVLLSANDQQRRRQRPFDRYHPTTNRKCRQNSALITATNTGVNARDSCFVVAYVVLLLLLLFCCCCGCCLHLLL